MDDRSRTHVTEDLTRSGSFPLSAVTGARPPRVTTPPGSSTYRGKTSCPQRLAQPRTTRDHQQGNGHQGAVAATRGAHPGVRGGAVCPNLLQRPPSRRSARRESLIFRGSSRGRSRRETPLQQIRTRPRPGPPQEPHPHHRAPIRPRHRADPGPRDAAPGEKDSMSTAVSESASRNLPSPLIVRVRCREKVAPAYLSTSRRRWDEEETAI